MLGALIRYNRAPDVLLGISRSAIDAAVRRRAVVFRFLRRGARFVLVALTGVIPSCGIVCARHQFALARIIRLSIAIPGFSLHHPELPACFVVIGVHASMDVRTAGPSGRWRSLLGSAPSYLRLPAQNPALYGFSRKGW